MSLRTRLLSAIGVALLVSFMAGTGLSAWQAARLVQVEVASALATGAQSLVGTLQDMGGAPTRPALVRLVARFDGSRHVMAELMDGQRAIAASQPEAPAISPAWFLRFASPDLPAIVLPAGAGLSVRLSPVPASEVGERWGEVRRLMLLLALWSALSAGLCLATVAISLRPLAMLGHAFGRLGQGREAGAVPEAGPAEITALAASFNRMRRALQASDHENRRLSAQLGRLAEEERADLARDLHDEIGPALFAITAWAASARLQGQAGDAAAASASLGSLENAAGELQQAVRGLLRRLRDSAPVVTDLAGSLEEMLEVWRAVRPQTVFVLRLPQAAESAPEPAKAALFRVAQEGVSNAVRHGNPSRVEVDVAWQNEGLQLSVTDDGAPGAMGNGYGLAGMEERLQALGGTVRIARDGGWRVTAWAPADPGAAA